MPGYVLFPLPVQPLKETILGLEQGLDLLAVVVEVSKSRIDLGQGQRSRGEKRLDGLGAVAFLGSAAAVAMTALLYPRLAFSRG